MKTIRLHPGKERSLLRGHPWIFESAIAKGGGDLGETVRVEAADGRFLAWGAFSPHSRIRVRVWSTDEAQRIDAAFIEALCLSAVLARGLFDIQSDGLRLVHGEADGLPGVILDRFGAVAVLQMTFAGAERWREAIVDAIRRALPELEALYERSDSGARRLEGLEPRSGLLFGTLPETVVIEEVMSQAA